MVVYGLDKPGFSARDLMSFVRIETCLFISGISISGYLMFNPISIEMLYVFLAVFFSAGIGYAYNHMTDKEEDIINNKRLNSFASGRTGYVVVLACLSISLISAAFLSPLSMIFYVATMLVSVMYSWLRVKDIFILKNVFTGLGIAFTFLIGALICNIMLYEMVQYFFLIFMFGLMLNLLGDIRGYMGDMSVGLHTLPVVFGPDAAKKAVYSLACLFSFTVLLMGFMVFMSLIPFMLAISLFLSRDYHKAARATILTSFVFFSALLFVRNLMGGL